MILLSSDKFWDCRHVLQQRHVFIHLFSYFEIGSYRTQAGFELRLSVTLHPSVFVLFVFELVPSF